MSARTMMAALTSSESTEWYTPKPYIEAAREVMGRIDVDPASNELANRIVQAALIYTKETNGYDKPWPGNVWLNPPYGFDSKKGNQSRWAQRLIEQYQAGITQQAILLVNAKTSEKWFQPLYDYPICFTHHRIRFYNASIESGQPTVGTAFVYFGSHDERFYAVFRQFGRVVDARPMPHCPSLWQPSVSREVQA